FTVVVLPAITVPESLSRGSKPCADPRTRNGPAGSSNRYAPSAPVVTLWPAPGPSVTRTCAPDSGPSESTPPWVPYTVSCLRIPWTIPVVATGTDEGAVGVSDAPHAVT